MLFLGGGPNTIRIVQPLVVTNEQADIAMDVLEDCIKTIAGEQTGKKATLGQQVGA